MNLANLSFSSFKKLFSSSSIILAVIIGGCQQPTGGNESPSATSTLTADEGSPLASWSDAPQTAITTWMKDVTDEKSSNFIPVADRIAVFDNDGTLWSEQPVPNQAQFAFDSLKARVTEHPEWKKDPVITGVINNDMTPLKKGGMKALIGMLNASHSGVTSDAFDAAVKEWLDTARDARFGKKYTELVYAPMVELLGYLRSHGFQTFIVSGGGADFMRVFTDEVYGIPPQNVVGSYGELVYEVKDGKPVVNKVPGNLFVDDKGGKPVAIRRFIGKVPVFCGGNSDGDQAMMQYTSGSKYKSMCVILHHTDSAREFAYDTKTLSGHLETALVEAKEKNWLVVDMAKDFKKIFAFE